MLTIKNPLEKLFDAIDRKENDKVLALIVYAPLLLQQTNERGLTPLMDAVLSKNYDAMRLMLRHGANPNQTDMDGWSAKSWAVFIQDRKAQRILSKVSVLTRSDDLSGAVFGVMSL